MPLLPEVSRCAFRLQSWRPWPRWQPLRWAGRVSPRRRRTPQVCRPRRRHGRHCDLPDPGHRPRLHADHQLPDRLPRPESRSPTTSSRPGTDSSTSPRCPTRAHALRAGHHRRRSTTRPSRRGAPRRWCSRPTRASAARTRRPSTSRSTGIRAAQADHDRHPVPGGHPAVPGDPARRAERAGRSSSVSPWTISPAAGLDPTKYQNFAITDDALIFFFSQGELLPEAAGALQVSVPRGPVDSMIA